MGQIVRKLSQHWLSVKKNREMVCCVDGCGRNRENVGDYCYIHIEFDATEKEGTRHCYFIKSEDDKAVKIGRSGNVGLRFSSLQASSPQRLVLVGMIPEKGNMEYRLHRRLSKYRMHGEWFRVDGDVIEAMDMARAGNYDGIVDFVRQAT